MNMYVVNQNEDLETINEIYSKVDQDQFLCISLSKTSKAMRRRCLNWLNEKIDKKECNVPTLTYALRNSKEIVN